MDNKRQHIQEQVQETMGLLGHQEPVKAGPWFRARTHNKLRMLNNEASDSKGSWAGLLLRPGVLALVVILNITTFFVAMNPSAEAQDMRETYLDTLASEYRLSVSSELLETYAATSEL